MILPCRGLGSDIKRALETCSEIDFIDDREVKVVGQSLNSELYSFFFRPSISDKLIFDATQYLFASAKNSALSFKDRAISQRPVNVRNFFENLIFEDVTICNILSIFGTEYLTYILGEFL